jgi:hypothetical protein
MEKSLGYILSRQRSYWTNLSRISRLRKKGLHRVTLSNSVLTAKDWKKIERLLKEVVPDFHDKRVVRLNDTIQDLAPTNILLQHKIEGYQRALQNEKKKRQRAKPLFHQLATQQDGHATFFSPKKVQEARDLQKK